jgi:hypothetical protein
LPVENLEIIVNQQTHDEVMSYLKSPKPRFCLARTGNRPSSPIRCLRLPQSIFIHQPHGFFQHQEILLHHVGPVLDIAQLLHRSRSTIGFSLQQLCLFGKSFRVPSQVTFLLLDSFGLKVNVCGALLELRCMVATSRLK